MINKGDLLIAEPNVLSDINFLIPKGSTCAIVGKSGSGKSTLALSLLSILTGNKKNRLKAAAPYSEVTANRIWNAFPPKKNGWQAVTVIGERISLSQAISEQLKAKNIMEMGEEETPSNIIIIMVGNISISWHQFKIRM